MKSVSPPREILPPRAKLHLAAFEDSLVVATCRTAVVLLEFGGEEPGTLLRILQCTGQFPTTKNYLTKMPVAQPYYNPAS